MAEEMNLYQKLSNVRKAVEVMQKDKSGYGYKYVTDSELLAKISGLMRKYGISLIPSVVPGTMVVAPYTYEKTKRDKQRDGTFVTYSEKVNEILVHGEMKYTWVNDENPDERIIVDWVMVGHQGDGSQGFGSALTYSMRYFLLKYFNVATPDDDPDGWRAKQKAAENAEEKAIAEQIIGVLHENVTGFLAGNSDKAPDVKKFLTLYVKNGDYFKVTEPVLAEQLLNDFKKKFINKEENK